MAIEEITVLVKYLCPHSGEQQKTADVSIDFNLGDFRRDAQEVFGIPKTRKAVLILEKTGEVLSNEKTFRSAAIQNNTVLALIPEMG
jgi:hypothetical protein